MHYPHVVSFEAPTEVRTPSGGVTYTFAAVDGLSDLPARCIPASQAGEADTERMILERDIWTIVVQGDHQVDVAMRANTDHAGPLDVIRVQRPVIYRSPATNATIVTAEKVSAEAAS